MLDYGTKAQVIFDCDTEHPANEGTDYFNYETYPVTSNMVTASEENMDMDLNFRRKILRNLKEILSRDKK